MKKLNAINDRMQAALDRLDDCRPGTGLVIMLSFVMASTSLINFGNPPLVLFGIFLLFGALLSRFTYLDRCSIRRAAEMRSPFIRELSLLGLKKMPRSHQDLRAAYVSEVKRLHPDTNGQRSKPANLDDISTAYERLSSVIKAARNI